MATNQTHHSIEQLTELAQHLVKVVTAAHRAGEEYVVLPESTKSAFKWLSTSDTQWATGAILEAITEPNTRRLRELIPDPKAPKNLFTEVCRRIAYQYAYIGEELSGPALYNKFKEGWAVLAAWSRVTGIVLLVWDSKKGTALDEAVSKLKASDSDREVFVFGCTDKEIASLADQLTAGGRAFLKLKLVDAEAIVARFCEGASQSSWKHYRTDGLRLVFGITKEKPVKPPSIAALTLPPDIDAVPDPQPESPPAAPVATVADQSVSTPPAPLGLHELCVAATARLRLGKIVVLKEFDELIFADQVTVDLYAGEGTTTALKYATSTLMSQHLADALYIDLADSDLHAHVNNLPTLIAEAARKNSADPIAQDLVEQTRRALTAGWLKILLDHADRLERDQLEQLMVLLRQVPKWVIVKPPPRWLYPARVSSAVLAADQS